MLPPFTAAAPEGALVLTAAPLVGDPFEDAVDPFDPAGGTIETVFPWSDTFEQKLIDFDTVPPWFTEARLQFGPPCLDDPFRRRGDEARTDFEEETILALARHLGRPAE